MQTSRLLSAGPLTGPGGGLFGPVQRGRALFALLAVGIALSCIGTAVNAANERWLVAAAEVVLMAGKVAFALWALRTPTRNDAGVNAAVAYTTVCTVATNVMFPGDARPFTAQLLLGVVFVGLFLPSRQVVAQLALMTVASVMSAVGVDPVGANLARLATLLVTGGATAAMCRTIRSHYDRATTQASLDPLTGIANRRAFDDQARSAVAHAERFGESLALLFVDLDGFKRLNDEHGHDAGDAELCEVARRLAGRAREQDGVYRIGGDEFALLLPGTEAVGAARLAQDLVTDVTRGLRVGMTVGVAAFPRHADHAGALLRAADVAMLEGKRTGKGRVVIASEPAGTPR